MLLLLNKQINYCFNNAKFLTNVVRRISTSRIEGTKSGNETTEFETVFSLPAVKYIALFNRLKMYHFIGLSLAIPTCSVMEMTEVIAEYTSTVAFIGISAGVLMTAVSLPFRNIIGFLYVNKDNTKIKISSVDFWGRRRDKIVDVDDWIPLLEIPSKTLDTFYLTPQLTDGSKYKLLLRYGKVFNASKIGQVLE